MCFKHLGVDLFLKDPAGQSNTTQIKSLFQDLSNLVKYVCLLNTAWFDCNRAVEMKKGTVFPYNSDGSMKYFCMRRVTAAENFCRVLLLTTYFLNHLIVVEATSEFFFCLCVLEHDNNTPTVDGSVSLYLRFVKEQRCKDLKHTLTS